MIKGKKGEGGGMGLNKIITIVIVLVVLFAILMFVFRAKVNEMLMNLPGYGSQEDKTIDYTKLTPDQLAALKVECFGRVVIGSSSKGFFDFKWAPGLVDYARIEIPSGNPIGLYWYYDRGDGPIGKSFGSTNIGHAGQAGALKKTITIDMNLASDSGISMEYLQLLNGAEIAKDNRICK